MSIFITGDLHGRHYIHKLHEFADRYGAKLTRDDYLVILGDLCVPWNDPPSDEDESLLDELNAFPWTTLFIDGNHENFDALRAYPRRTWHGGSVHVLRDHVLHLMRGHVFTIDGRTLLAMGGAVSIDRAELRASGSWWPQEAPSEREKALCLRSLARHGWQVDYVLTHCPPAGQLPEYYEVYGIRCHPDAYNRWLQKQVADRAAYRQWFFGHMHDDRPWEPVHVALMHVVYDLDGRFPDELWGPDNPIDTWETGDI